MKIGDLAKRTGLTVETIRYYEQEGLLTVAQRTSGNYRVYADAHVERLIFIRNCRALDMRHEEIRTLLAHQDKGGENCDVVDALLQEHIGHVTRRITELQHLAQQLQALRSSCGCQRSIQECGILKGLAVHEPELTPTLSANVHVLGTHANKR